MNTTITLRHHVLFLASIFCFWFATYIYIPTFSLYLEYQAFPLDTIGIILGSYGVTQVLLRFPLGVLSDRLQYLRKALYIAGFVFAIVSGLMLIYFDSFFPILMARLFAGVTAAMWVMATIMYAQYFRPDQSSRAMGTVQFLTVTPQFISMASAGFLVSQFGWSLPFWIAVVFSVLGLVLALAVKVVPVEAGSAPKMKLSEYVTGTLKVKYLLPVTTVSMLCHAIMFITIFGFTPLYASSLGVTEGELIWLMTGFFVPHAAASLGVAFASISPERERFYFIGGLVLTVVMLAAVPMTNSLLTLSLVHGVIGLALGVVLPLLLANIARLPGNQLKNSVMGFYQSFYALGIFLGPLIGGAVAENIGLNAVFVMGSIFAAAALGVVWLYFKDRKPAVNNMKKPASF